MGLIARNDPIDSISDIWRLCDELSIRQAAMLIVGFDPAGEMAYAETWKIHERPAGYEAAKQALISALKNNLIDGHHFCLADTDMNGNNLGDIPGTTDIELSMVLRESLISWLRVRGIKSDFFFPIYSETPEYLNPNSTRYANKLAAAVAAWTSVTDPGPKSPKQALDKWLREHASQFGLTNEDGLPIEAAIEECSKVANWRPGGGAPKTPG